MGYSVDGTTITNFWYKPAGKTPVDPQLDTSFEGLMNRHLGFNKNGWKRISGTGETKEFTYANIARSEWMDRGTQIFQLGEGGGSLIAGGQGALVAGGAWNRFIVNGGNGSDTIIGGRKDDHIQAGRGNDTVRGGAGNDRLWGEGGDDTIYGEAGRDIIYGNSGNDTVYGGDGSDLLMGHAGDDTLDGGNGDDILLGGIGTDKMTGGAGNDLFYLSADAGLDIITDFTKGDRIAVEQKAGDTVNVDYSAGVTTILLNGKAIGKVTGEVKLEDIITGDAEGRVLKNT